MRPVKSIVRARILRSAKDWVKDPETWRHQYPLKKSEIYTARLTIDITPELRKQLRAQAFQENCTMSVLVRRWLEESFGVRDKSASDRAPEPRLIITESGSREVR